MPMSGAGSIELLAARSLALLRSLTEFEHQPFLDQASESPATKELARHTATRATHFAGSHLLALHHASPALYQSAEVLESWSTTRSPKAAWLSSSLCQMRWDRFPVLQALAMTGEGRMQAW